MRAIVFDAEAVVQWRIETDPETGKERTIIDGSPFHQHNRLVTAHWKLIDIIDGKVILPPNRTKHSIYYHTEYEGSDAPVTLQEALDQADIFVAHNAKYDYTYLLESGFRLPDKVWCTMVGEYVLARGVRVDLSLEDTAKRRNSEEWPITLKDGDETHALFDDGIGYDRMPLPLVLKYGDTDVDSCADIFVQQWTEFQDKTKTRKLSNIIELMNDMLLFLVEIERNGVCVDLESLSLVEQDYVKERNEIINRLTEIAQGVLGDTPFNLNSGEDISKIVFSRYVTDKKLHKEVFNLGVDQWGRFRFPPFMSPTQFTKAVSSTTKKMEKKEAHNCPSCNGYKKIRKFKKDGTPFKNENICKTCDGLGFILIGTGKVAGFKLLPEGPRDAAVYGFKADKDSIDRLIYQATQKDNLEAVEFLTKKKRLNAINTYLNSFVKGIQRWTRNDNILHPSFNQCVARTGRLSSSDPNFQNQPKGRKFPVRRSIVSRWQSDGGLILEADFSGLEFVVAGELSRDSQIIEDILTGKDIHGQTASIVSQKTVDDNGDPINWKDDEHKPYRDENKPYTFAPLYGGQGANEPEHIKRYFKEFFNIYSGHGEWQFQQMDTVIKHGYIATPSGREYMFPGTKRLKGRKTTNATNIVNYPVQGFATGDIVPLACVRALRIFKSMGLRSLLILTVHDSIVVDVYPGERDQVVQCLKWAMTEIDKEIVELWEYQTVLPFNCEMSIGPNWQDMKGIHI